MNEIGKSLAPILLAAMFFSILIANSESPEEKEEYCYAPYSTAVIPERMSTKVLVDVIWFHEGTRGGDVFADWIVGDDGTVDCTLWLRMPQQILGDPDMDGIGHEFLHCVAGDFHPEDY